jgi:site-specific DNA-methyltransferase (adenine-specific)
MELKYDLYNEDCVRGISKLKDNSVDFIYCDLPFLCTQCSWDQVGVDLKKLSIELWRVAKAETPIVFSCNMKFFFKIIEAMGQKWFKFEMIWQKHNSTNPFSARIRPMPSHELLAFFYKKQPKIYYQNILKYHKKKSERFVNPVIQRGQLYKDEKYTLNMVGGKVARYTPVLPRSVLKIDKISKCQRSINSTEKPYDLLWFLLKYYTKEGDVVLDPTFGSCSMGAVCKDKKRSFIGFEIDERQFKHGQDRIKEAGERMKMAQEDHDAP